MEIDSSVVVNVTQNICGLTLIILGCYPVTYICRNMINFVAKAFNGINVDRAFKMPNINLSKKEE